MRWVGRLGEKTFCLSGTSHSVVGDALTVTASDGASIVPWLLQFVGDDAAWAHAGP